ncbi:hypothetical protein GLAREA_01323 [Glarea lozoyensis ATCC 20868]|uniref:Uncharacterized protein n=1 Tax=Glarea lozoyensis (strain ATCC 20868 / MF5171) TaxID=1116229 RepID=S3D023_GLAL2|nr:uncharacterized protein GLAREA_01323 [Glarea lozoyensis ATCC 20868]EPE25411.1 hypothetical protein GLAREA_01323 [Glarea lozoyensis ATCC 20868]
MFSRRPIQVAILAFIFGLLVQASPAPTASSQGLLSTGISPRPTEEAVLVDPLEELKKRDYRDICGYATGNTLYPVTCAVGYRCAVNNYQEAMGCCPAGNFQYCQLATSCIPYASLNNCGLNCQADYGIGKCNAQYRYCATFRSLYGTTTFSGYQCAISPSIIVTVETASDATRRPVIETITATSIPSASITAAPIVYYQNFYDNSTANQTNSEVHTEGKGGLSKGEIAGIVIGAVTGVFTLVATIAAVISCCT